MNNIQTIRYRPRIIYLNNVFAYLTATVMIFFWRLLGSSYRRVSKTSPPPPREAREFILRSEKERAIDGLLKRAATEWAEDNIVLAEMIFVEAVKIRDMTEAEFNKL